MSKRKIGNFIVTLTNENTIIFPKGKITKIDLVNYYEKIAPLMLPFLKNRPISMQRFPGGILEEGFYQKDAADYFPPFVKRAPIKKHEDGIVHYVVCNNAATLVYLANLACVTPHIWLSRIDNINIPDRMIFDLDPAGNKFAEVQRAALIVHDYLDSLGLRSFAMTTGSRGIHVIVPLKRHYDFDYVRSYARRIAENIISKYPDDFTIEMRKGKRGKKIFIDVLRNAFGQTGVAPYAVRAKANAPVATPITWNEVADKLLTPTKYTIKNIFEHLKQKPNPWRGFESTNSLPKNLPEPF